MAALVSVLGLVSYFTVFYQFPVLRDIPWANLLILVGGLGLAIWAVVRRVSMWSIAGAVFSAACSCLFVWYIFGLSAVALDDSGIARVGEQVPALALQNHDGEITDLATYAGSKVLLVFYRGYW